MLHASKTDWGASAMLWYLWGFSFQHSQSTVPLPSYTFQKFMFDNIIFVHQWSAIISYHFMILFVGIHKQYWHPHFVWRVLSTSQACFMVMAWLITAFPAECSENQSSSDKKGILWQMWEQMLCMLFRSSSHGKCKQDNHHMFSFVWNWFKGSIHDTIWWSESVVAVVLPPSRWNELQLTATLQNKQCDAVFTLVVIAEETRC